MLIIIERKPNSTQWDYPQDSEAFPNGFQNPDNNKQLVVENNTGKDLAELSSLAGYPILEYVSSSLVTLIEITNIQIPAAELNGSIYWVAKDAPIVITADCPLPDGELMVMVERVIDATNTVDDVRTKAVITAGVMTINFAFDTSGNYIFRKSRLNEGLSRIGAEFNLNFEDVEFDVFI